MFASSPCECSNSSSRSLTSINGNNCSSSQDGRCDGCGFGSLNQSPDQWVNPKPAVERRRRARIRRSINELESMVLEATQKDSDCSGKLDIAGILELTVSHLKSLHKRVGVSTEGTKLHSPAPGEPTTGFAQLHYNESLKFKEGYTNCISAVKMFFTAVKTENLSVNQLETGLLHHLTSCVDKCDDFDWNGGEKTDMELANNQRSPHHINYRRIQSSSPQQQSVIRRVDSIAHPNSHTAILQKSGDASRGRGSGYRAGADDISCFCWRPW